MFGAFAHCDAKLFARLPTPLHWQRPMTDWALMTRPGQRLHSFLEGAVFDVDGSLWLSDVPFGRIFRIDPDGVWQVALSYEGQPHAARPLDGGDMVIADYRRGLLSWRPGTTEPKTLVGEFGGEPFRGLSDLVVGPQGIVWFTDSGRSSLSDPSGRLFRLETAGPMGGGPSLALANIPYPNGVAVSDDGASVLIAVTRANAIWRTGAGRNAGLWPMAGIHIALSGGLGPDGLCVDPLTGRLAVAQAQAGRAYVFDRVGDPLFVVRTPGPWTTSVTFGPDGALYVVEAERGEVWRAVLPAGPEIRSAEETSAPTTKAD